MVIIRQMNYRHCHCACPVFEGRMRVISKGEFCEIRFEDTANGTGELFASAPIPYGKRTTYVEAVVDSSRNYVVRVEDSTSRQHAFLGMSFSERSDSFDFNEALLRHDKQVERERAAAILSNGPPAPSISQSDTAMTRTSASEQAVLQDVKSLYAGHDDYALKEGQTIKVNIQKKAPKPGGLFSSSATNSNPGLGLSVPFPSKDTTTRALGLIPPPPSW
ncbi:hypothetical protein CEUSTIGMA_g2977.t1 [Chlamydomonas eustigma]|uniref:NECAP PHear domain-containing protein n=1 Tax=Chlamydomonas eustigma TaxID=1157962 RepID=A0A250WXI2_9CHLO|nr:hypothetical protein CEUSTIGMA_g2977.t1 [Chlamydomonas eustigma]|eukprot:GAX75534.1 hypothetical protein CEUSTIGMA_g2977.t1 [Chlamydomonas eustigma]